MIECDVTANNSSRYRASSLSLLLGSWEDYMYFGPMLKHLSVERPISGKACYHSLPQS